MPSASSSTGVPPTRFEPYPLGPGPVVMIRRGDAGHADRGTADLARCRGVQAHDVPWARRGDDGEALAQKPPRLAGVGEAGGISGAERPGFAFIRLLEQVG
jgi:hypothetical protein